MAILMELSRIIIRDQNDRQIIVLKEVTGERKFPIVILNDVAVAIDRRLKGIPSVRPMTHDLLANAITELGGQIERIEINDLKESTYFAKVILRQNGKRIELDSRPSDAIALGVAGRVPIYVEEHVLEAACE